MANNLPLTLRAYRAISALATPLAGTIIRRRLKQGKEDSARIGERRGNSSVARPAGPLVWIHGASVGEILAAAGLIERLRAVNVRILLTSGTVTSAAVAAKRFHPDVIHQYVPLDAPRFVDKFLDHWRPNLALFIESDFWPNLILSSAQRRIPLVLINGRMSQRSFPRWRRLHGTIAAILDSFDLCLTQSDVDGNRFSALGGRNVLPVGNLKLDVQPPLADPVKFDHLKAVTERRLVMVAASTHPGEEEIVLDAHRRLEGHFPSLLSIIVPRHPKRGAAIARTLAASGMRVALRSRDQMPTDDIHFYIADTMGEMGLFYRLAPVVFMGGSMVDHGGQNPIEAVKLGASVLHGPHVFNFADVYEALDAAGGAARVDSDEDFVRQLRHLLANPVARERALGAAESVVYRMSGALNKTLTALEPYLLQLRLEQDSANA